MNPHEKKIAEAMGYDKARPIVQFFDHAVLNAEKTKESGRPRYDAKTYIRKIPSAPDLVVRDVFDRAMLEEDKKEYPEEWALYHSRKQAVSNLKPLITAIPGMDVAKKAELEALEVYDCEAFVNYEGTLEGLEELREVAKRIMEVSDAVREKRQDLRNAEGRQADHNGSVHRYESRGSGEAKVVPIKKEETQTFHYEVKL